MHYHWTDPITSQSVAGTPLACVTSRPVQTLLGLLLRLLPQGERVQRLHSRTMLDGVRQRKRRELTEDDHEGENVNPVLLNKTLLWLGRDNLALGCERWGRTQLRPRVAFDQIPGRIHACDLSPHRTNQNKGPDPVGPMSWSTHKGGSLGFRTWTVVFANVIGLIARASACVVKGQTPSSGRGERK